MWRLVWKDSFHLNKNNASSMIYTPMYLCYFNLFVLGDHSAYEYVFSICFLCFLVMMALFPIKLAKGLFLCPLTEVDRNKFFYTACLLRFGFMTALLGLTLFVSRFFLKANSLILVLQFICSVVIILVGILLCINTGSSATNLAVRQYYITQKLPVPVQPMKKSDRRANLYSNLMLAGILILGTIGVLLHMDDMVFNRLLWLYYIPAMIVSIVLFTTYFTKYFMTIVAINVNREVFDYSPNKKVGAFDAD